METRKRILEFIISYIKEHKYPPTIREICAAVNLKSTASVQSQLEIMFFNGMLETDAPGSPRALRIPGMKYMTRDEMEAAEWIPVEKGLPKTDDFILLSFNNFGIPMVGRYEVDREGGAFYIGDDEESCVSQFLFVNAWRPLPKPYAPKEM